MELPEFLIKRRDEQCTKGPCLIPKPEAKCAPVCHERDYCDCEIKCAYTQGALDVLKEVEGLVEACEESTHADGCNTIIYQSRRNCDCFKKALSAWKEKMGEK